jgi:hypothetical protein
MPRAGIVPDRLVDGGGSLMARMIAAVYQAFKAAGVDDGTAKAAATALAQRDDEFHEIKSEMRLLNWKVNAVLGLLIILVVQPLLLPLFTSAVWGRALRGRFCGRQLHDML